jgi:sugar-specific transcriptional regulator TrmB
MKKENQNLKESLRIIGLSDKEADTYCACLELGRGTVTEISRKADIHRTTGYTILNSLVNKKLIRISGKEPKQEYVAESPDNILDILNQDLERLQKNIKATEQLVPELKLIHKTENRPQIKFYEGVEGLKEVYEDTLTSKEPIRAYAAYEDMHATLKDYFPSYYKRRAAKGIHARGIVPRTPASAERAKHNTEEAREIARIPPEVFGISPEIDIYDNKVMIASWREKLGIIIESKEIAEAMKKIFELAWKEALRLDAEAK